MTQGNEAKEQVEADRVLSDTSCNPYNTGYSSVCLRNGGNSRVKGK